MNRAVFLHGRPSHPFHQALARSIGAEPLPIDFLLRYQDVPASRTKRYLSWLACGTCFPDPARYDVFLTEGIQFVPGILKASGRLSRDQLTCALVANETPYFLRSGYYGGMTKRALLWALRSYDLVLCHGGLIGDLVTEVLGGSLRKGGPQVAVFPSGLSEKRRKELSPLAQSQRRLAAPCLLSIGGGDTAWRAHYKGLDLLLSAAEIVRGSLPDLKVQVVGRWEKDALPKSIPSYVQMLGERTDLRESLLSSDLYVALGRGDAGPLSVLEAMTAGVPALVSVLTGLRDAACAVSPELVSTPSAEAAAERIVAFYRKGEQEREILGRRAAEVAASYKEEESLRVFGEALSAMKATKSWMPVLRDGIEVSGIGACHHA